ncbi:MAG: GntR family transcriptional regulator [Amphritea sp.]
MTLRLLTLWPLEPYSETPANKIRSPVINASSPGKSDKITARARIDTIHDLIRERICLLTYAPGSILREAQLAEEFGCSRTPIREAIKRLEFENLVISKNGVGTLVTEADFDSLKDVYEMRLKVAELIGTMSPTTCETALVEKLQTIRNRADHLHTLENDLEEMARINHELHYLVSNLIGNSALRHLYNLYYFQTIRVWYQLMPHFWSEEVQALKDELDELINAVKRNDIIAVGYTKRNYIARMINLLQQIKQPKEVEVAS